MLSQISQDDYRRVKTILEQALDLEADARRSYLQRACAGDANLLAEAESLLAAHDRSDEFLENFSAARLVQKSFADTEDFEGQIIGSYCLTNEIGRGGMGVVYLATREDFRQQVAVKLIKRGMDSDTILERFAREREILAHLNHPFIARLTDGGTTKTGSPYFVMEYVEGVPIDEYCRTNDLSEKEILELFRKVCEAVSFAHQKLIIHRDLKPSNILVTGERTPKLLDFGIAKLLNATGGRETETLMRPLTPAYASPEQIFGAASIDTTSDVYSLGVILYELLTGAKPYDVESHRPFETGGSVFDQPPPKPSAAVGQQTADAIGVADKDISIRKKSLRGDLDNILLKALSRQPGERYESIEQFSEDVRRHLEGLPVKARKATAVYRGIKFIRRNKISFIAATLILATLLVGIIATTQQRIRAENSERINHRLLYAARMGLAYQAWDAANPGRAVNLLEAQRAEDAADGEDRRGFEWNLLWRLTHDASVRVFNDSNNLVTAVAVSPNGEKIAGLSLSGRVSVWIAATGQLVKAFDVGTNNALTLAFSHDGKYLATSGANHSAVLWDAESWQIIETFSGHTDNIAFVAFSPDDQILATASFDGTTKLWNAKTGAIISTLKGHTNTVYALAFAPDGKTLATASYDHTAKLWDIATSKETATLQGHSWLVLTVAFAPDGKTLATSGSDGTIKLWDVASRRERRTISGEGFTIDDLAFAPDGKTLAANGSDNLIKIYDAASGALKNILRGHSDIIAALAFAPDGKTLISGSADRTVRIWDVNQQSGATVFDGHKDWVWSLAFAPDSQTLASAGKDGAVKLWNVQERREIKTLPHEQWVNGVAYSPDGRQIATASDDKFVRVWNSQTGELIFTLSANDAVAECVAFSPDGKILASGNKKGDIFLWNAETGAVLNSFRSPDQNLIWWLAFAPDGKTLVSAEGGLTDLQIMTGHVARVWSISDGKLIKTLDAHTSDVRAAAFSPDGKTLVTGGNDRTIKFWDAATFREIATLETDRVQSLAFSTDGARLVSAGSNKTIKIWDAATRQELCTLTVSSAVNSVAFSPDNNILAAAGNDHKVKLWFANPATVSDRK